MNIKYNWADERPNQLGKNNNNQLDVAKEIKIEEIKINTNSFFSWC